MTIVSKRLTLLSYSGGVNLKAKARKPVGNSAKAKYA